MLATVSYRRGWNGGWQITNTLPCSSREWTAGTLGEMRIQTFSRTSPGRTSVGRASVCHGRFRP
jgi:hypothetical protein